MINTIQYHGKDRKTEKPISPAIILIKDGPFIEISITQPPKIVEKLNENNIEVKSIKVRALIDTGASSCVVTKRIVDELRLIQTGVRKVSSVQDIQTRPEYIAHFQFHWGTSITIPIVECPLQSVDAIIGRDVMCNWNLIYNGAHGYLIIND